MYMSNTQGATIIENQRRREIFQAIDSQRLAHEVSQSQRLSISSRLRQVGSDSIRAQAQGIRKLTGAWAQASITVLTMRKNKLWS